MSVKFPSGMTNRGLVKTTDKLIIHNVDTGQTQFTTVGDVIALATGGGGEGGSWGFIIGTLSNQTDLVDALNLKAPLASPTFTGTPTGITKTHVGLGSVDDTSDASKPVSTAQQTALNLKANKANETHTGITAISTLKLGLFTFEIVSDQLVLKYDGTVKYRFNSSGILEASDHKNGLV